MKKVFIIMLAGVMTAMTATMVQAQGLEQGEPAIVYYSPKNYVVLDFTYTMEEYEVGPFAQYADQMLGIKDAITESKTVYTLSSVSVATRTEADHARMHKVVAENGLALQLLTLNSKGVLVGYNLPANEPQHADHPKHSKDQPKVETATVLPYTEEILEAKSLAAQAQAIAKHIFRLRETKLYLLSGEIEHAPADGEAMRRVLDELDKQEAALVELFTGKKTTTVLHKKVEYLPMGENGKRMDKQLFFSSENGFTSADNVDAEPIDVSIEWQIQQTTPAVVDPKAKGKGTVQPSQIVYNLPGNGTVKVRHKGVLMAKRNLPLAQFGVDVPLARDLFSGKQLPSIQFSEKTGNIVSINF